MGRNLLFEWSPISSKKEALSRISTIQEKEPGAKPDKTEERSGRGDRPVPGWMINLYSSTERGGEKTKILDQWRLQDLDLCWERVPCKSPPGPPCSLFFFFFFFSSFFLLLGLNVLFIYFFCFFVCFCLHKWKQFTPLTLSTIISKDIRCDFWCYKLFPLLSHVILVLVIRLLIVKYPDQ